MTQQFGITVQFTLTLSDITEDVVIKGLEDITPEPEAELADPEYFERLQRLQQTLLAHPTLLTAYLQRRFLDLMEAYGKEWLQAAIDVPSEDVLFQRLAVLVQPDDAAAIQQALAREDEAFNIIAGPIAETVTVQIGAVQMSPLPPTA